LCRILDIGGGDHPCGDIVIDLVSPSKTSGVDYVVGDACYLPFRSNVFLRVVSYGALNYFFDDGMFFKEVARIMKRDGILLLSAFSYYSFFVNFLDVLGRNPSGAFKLAFNTIRRRYRWYSVGNLMKKLTYSGFKVIKAYQNVSFFWRPTSKPYNILVVATL